MAGQFLEVFNLADPVHLIDDSVQDGLDLLIRFFLKERTLALQPAPVAQELFLVEIGYSLPFALFGFHEGRHYNSNSTNPQASF
jgi:hypothetical protein